MFVCLKCHLSCQQSGIERFGAYFAAHFTMQRAVGCEYLSLQKNAETKQAHNFNAGTTLSDVTWTSSPHSVTNWVMQNFPNHHRSQKHKKCQVKSIIDTWPSKSVTLHCCTPVKYGLSNPRNANESCQMSKRIRKTEIKKHLQEVSKLTNTEQSIRCLIKNVKQHPTVFPFTNF